MKKRKIVCAVSLVCLFVLLLPMIGCTNNQTNSRYKLYSVNFEKNKIEEEAFYPVGNEEDTMAMIEEIFAALSEDGERKLLPEKVVLQDATLDDGTLILDVSAEYTRMDINQEILCRACLAKNFLQINDVNYIAITANRFPLVNTKGEEIGVMGADSFLENSGKNISSYQYTELELYFANEMGDKLVKETRNVYYTSNSPIEKVVMEQLLKGPQEVGHYAVLSSDISILGVSQADGVAYINLDERFLNQSLNVKEELPIYAIVNSIIAAENVKQVQISVNGETDKVFGKEMRLDQFYVNNTTIVADGAGAN